MKLKVRAPTTKDPKMTAADEASDGGSVDTLGGSSTPDAGVSNAVNENNSIGQSSANDVSIGLNTGDHDSGGIINETIAFSQPSSLTLTERLLEARRELVAQGGYLGEKTCGIASIGKWAKDPTSKGVGSNIFVSRESFDAHQAAMEQANETDDNVDIPALYMMMLSVVGTISDDNFFLNPFATYTGEGWTNNIVKAARMKFQLEKARVGNLFGADFAVDLKTASDIVSGVGDNALGSTGFIAKGPGNTSGWSNKLEFRHDILKDAEVTGHESWLPGINLKAGWPRMTDAARYKLDRMGDTHYIDPLHVYSKDGDKMEPMEYDKLKGALVQVVFTLSHSVVRMPGKSAFNNNVADVEYVKVLKLPPVVGEKRSAGGGPGGNGGVVKKMKMSM